MLSVILCFNVCYFPNNIVIIFYDDLPFCVLSQKYVKNYLSPNIPSMANKNIVGVDHLMLHIMRANRTRVRTRVDHLYTSTLRRVETCGKYNGPLTPDPFPIGKVILIDIHKNPGREVFGKQSFESL